MLSTEPSRCDDGAAGSGQGMANAASAAASTAGVRCVIATEEMAAEVARLMEQFVDDEPLLAAAGVTAAATRGALEPWMRAQLRQGLSIAAVVDAEGSLSSPCARRLVAALTCFIATQDEGGSPAAGSSDDDDDETLLLRHWFPHPAVADIEDLIGKAEAECGLHERFRPTSAWGDNGRARPPLLLAAVGQMVVDRAHRGAGLAQRMVAEVLQVARCRGCSALVAAASGARSHALFRRMQFDEIGESAYADVLDSNRFDLAKLSEHRALVVFVRDLRSPS